MRRGITLELIPLKEDSPACSVNMCLTASLMQLLWLNNYFIQEALQRDWIELSPQNFPIMFSELCCYYLTVILGFRFGAWLCKNLEGRILLQVI